MKNTTTIANKINNIKKINGKNYDRKLCVSYGKKIFTEETNSNQNDDISFIKYRDNSVLEFNARKQTTNVI